MRGKSERLSVLSEAEHEALYSLPDFDESQQLEHLSLTERELALATNRPGLHAQVYCVLQIGFFKAKHAFFRFDWSEVENDYTFVLSRYFDGEAFECKTITDHEHYTQRRLIVELFGYRLWAVEFLSPLSTPVERRPLRCRRLRWLLGPSLHLRRCSQTLQAQVRTIQASSSDTSILSTVQATLILLHPDGQHPAG